MPTTSPRTRRARRSPAGAARPSGLSQIRALSHPLRMRLLELFAEHPQTTKQAAERLTQPPTRLYHHVAALEKAGLIRLRETRPNRGALEKHYEIVSKRVTIGEKDPVLKRKGAGRDIAAMGIMVFDQARNELVRALEEGPPDESRVIMALRGALMLSPAAARELQRDLTERITKVSKDSAPGSRLARGSRRYSLTIALVPCEPGDE